VLACRRLGWNEVDALVCDESGASDERSLQLSLIDNDSPGRLSTVERAIALKKFSEQGYDIGRLAAEIAPKLGLPPSRRYIENCLALASIEIEILRKVHSGSLGADQAFCLLNLESDERLPVFSVLLASRANLNEARELVSLVPDVAAMKSLSIAEYVCSELAPIADDDSLPPRKRMQLLRELLKRERHPRLTDAESAFDAALNELELGESCRINAPKHFEGDDISITIKARDVEQIEKTLGKLSSPKAKDGLGKLFRIIKGEDIS
jgi:ParB-like chromosome segregation protein Spo0J